ncbi:hypothetical protein CKAH01_00740 [Colletotrichum kahawae]|uniref:Uncharacterized protein n=1 Tax=Colletotrichum kahawae TaxID=34407 RepID=A0AAE0D8D0_COLKA|nr:hypothetical protein CKAH01_00740 [Colletotrichum kahawae]
MLDVHFGGGWDLGRQPGATSLPWFLENVAKLHVTCMEGPPVGSCAAGCPPIEKLDFLGVSRLEGQSWASPERHVPCIRQPQHGTLRLQSIGPATASPRDQACLSVAIREEETWGSADLNRTIGMTILILGYFENRTAVCQRVQTPVIGALTLTCVPRPGSWSFEEGLLIVGFYKGPRCYW